MTHNVRLFRRLQSQVMGLAAYTVQRNEYRRAENGSHYWETYADYPDSTSDLKMIHRESDIEDGDTIWIEFPYCCNGDYGGAGAVGIANRKVVSDYLQAMATAYDWSDDHWRILGGMYGFETLYVRADILWLPPEPGYRGVCDRLIDLVKALEDYPVLDDDELSHQEIERQHEAWDSWAKSDFLKALCRQLNDSWAERIRDRLERMESIDANVIIQLFYTLAERSNTYWEDEYGGATIDVERIAKAVKRRDVSKAILPLFQAAKGKI